MKRVTGQKKNDGSPHEETRHLGVLIEHVDGKFDIVAEQYGDIKSTLNEHTKLLHAHTEMIGNLMVEMHIIKEDAEFIKHSLKRKVDVEEFAALERRVVLLEKKRV